jgi:hypothetical protein
MQKIGIITFFKAKNYGALLQAYSLQKVLTGLGYQVSFLDYDNRELNYRESLFKCDYKRLKTLQGFVRFIKNIFVLIRHPKKVLSRRKSFHNFIKNNFDVVKSIEASSITKIVVGSDQVWNPKITGGIDRFFLGEFSGGRQYVKSSYAASSEQMLDDNSLSKVKTALSKFNKISVREASLKYQLEGVSESKIPVVLDPTLLLTKNDFEEIENRVVFPEPYILVYQNNHNDILQNASTDLAEKFGLKVKTLVTNVPFRIEKDMYSDASVGDFLNLFRNASYVLTTSFHGLAFAILYEKNFLCFEPEGISNYRVRGLLEQLSLESRLITNENYLDVIDVPIDYLEVNNHINLLRARSTSFIDEMFD